MSYRIDNYKPPKPKHRDTAKISTHEGVHIDNGSIAHMAYPQWYIEQHMPIKHRPVITDRAELIKLWERCIYWDKDNRWCCHPQWNHCMHHDHCTTCNHYLDMARLIPIYLRKEYPEDKDKGVELRAYINFEKNADGSLVLPGLSATVSIDEEPFDYIIRATFKAECPEAELKPKKVKYALVIEYNKEGDEMKTVAQKGSVIVHPAILRSKNEL